MASPSDRRRRVPSRLTGTTLRLALVAFVAGCALVLILDPSPGQRTVIRGTLAGVTIALWLAGVALRWRDRTRRPGRPERRPVDPYRRTGPM